jgi:hypothetical protein
MKNFVAGQIDEATTRRDFLRSSALTIAAAGVTSLARQARAQAAAQAPAQAPTATARPPAGNATGGLFVQTDTVYGIACP